MKKIFILTLFLAILFTTFQSYADPQVPQLINLQMILADEGGNKLPDDVQQKDVTLQLVDGGGNVDFEEQQTIPVVRSAISVMVGQATDGGIPYEAFAPGESKILRVKLNDQSIPQEDLLIASVPYSMYAGYATNLTDPLDAAEVILNGSIDIEHLSEALLAYIDNAMIGISAQDLENHKTEQAAHPASSIEVENDFRNLAGDNLQSILESVDNNFGIKEQQDIIIDEVIQAVEAELESEMATLLKLDGSRSMAGNLNMGASNIVMAEGATVDEVDISELALTVTDITNNYVKTEDTTNWDKDASDDVTDDDTTNWDKDYTDDFNSSTIFSGDVSGTYDNLQLGSSVVGSSEIADGAVATSDMASSNISQWNNDSGYITDGNTNWNNEYNFITDGNTNWDNEYNFITDGNTNWDNTYNFITQADIDDDYVNYTGDTMTGSLTMSSANINMNLANIVMNDPSGCTPGSSCNTVDGEDVSELGRVIPDTSGDSDNDSDGDVDLDDRYINVDGGDTMRGELTMYHHITMNDTECVSRTGENCEVDGVDVSALAQVVYDFWNEPDEEINADNIPQSVKPFSYGTITGNLTSSDYFTTSGLNITDCDFPDTNNTRRVRCEFDTDFASGITNYQVVVTPGNNSCSTGAQTGIMIPTVYSRSETYFELYYYCSAGNFASAPYGMDFDFVVYYNEP